MAAKTATPAEVDVSAFNAAMQELAAAEQAVRDAQQRIADMGQQFEKLTMDAEDLEKRRGTALLRGEMEDAARLGKQYANAADGAKAASREQKAMQEGMGELHYALFLAERKAWQVHGEVMATVYEDERAKVVEFLRGHAYRAWRAGIAAEVTNVPFVDFMGEIAQELDMGGNGLMEVEVGLPVQEVTPSSDLLGRGNPRRMFGKGLREEMASRFQAERLAA